MVLTANAASVLILRAGGVGIDFRVGESRIGGVSAKALGEG